MNRRRFLLGVTGAVGVGGTGFLWTRNDDVKKALSPVIDSTLSDGTRLFGGTGGFEQAGWTDKGVLKIEFSSETEMMGWLLYDANDEFVTSDTPGGFGPSLYPTSEVRLTYPIEYGEWTLVGKALVQSNSAFGVSDEETGRVKLPLNADPVVTGGVHVDRATEFDVVNRGTAPLKIEYVVVDGHPMHYQGSTKRLLLPGKPTTVLSLGEDESDEVDVVLRDTAGREYETTGVAVGAREDGRTTEN